MHPDDPAITTLVTALAPNYDGKVPRPAWEPFARQHLRPGEHVQAALVGEGWTFVDRLLLAIGDRVMLLSRRVLQF